jgi:predicted nucleic-acid-binding protein
MIWSIFSAIADGVREVTGFGSKITVLNAEDRLRKALQQAELAALELPVRVSREIIAEFIRSLTKEQRWKRDHPRRLP